LIQANPPPNQRPGAEIFYLSLGLSIALLLGGDFFPLPLIAVALAARYGGSKLGLAATALVLALGLAAVARQTTPEAITFIAGQLINFVVVGLLVSALAGDLGVARLGSHVPTEALRQCEERYALALRGARDGLWEWDLRTGRLSYSQRMVELVGPAGEGPQDVMGDFAARLHPEDRERVLTALRDHLERRRAYDIEFRLWTASGEYRWFHASGQAAWDEHGRATRMAGSLGEITASKRAEEQLRAEKEAAEAAGRSKDLFLAMLSHELRTPLTPALLGLSGLLDDPAIPGELRPTLEAARRGVELEVRLVDDLLDATRIAAGKLRITREWVDVNILVRRALASCVRELAAGGLHVELDLAADGHPVEADPARLQQVVWNLVKNAARFTPPGGTITIRSRLMRESTRRDEGSCLVVEIADTGVGIEPELLPRLFQAFEQGGEGRQRRSGGLGLGLAISKAIAEAHGGRLTARSRGPGHGATFALVLRMGGRSAPPESGPRSMARAGSTAAMRILLVEDAQDTRLVLARLLRRRGSEVTTAGTLAEARSAALCGSYNLVISDLALPDGTGLDLMSWLRTRGTTPAIALTRYGMEEDVLRCQEASFAEHLTKPIELGPLEEAIRRVVSIKGRALRAESPMQEANTLRHL
jgi:PAS domain S-box-containing protein